MDEARGTRCGALIVAARREGFSPPVATAPAQSNGRL